MPSTSVRALLALTLLSAAALRAQETPAAPAAAVQPSAQEQTLMQQTTPPPSPGGAPLTLEECIALAMKKNFDLQIQGYTVEQARETLNVARADFTPTITGSSTRTLNRSSYAVQQQDGTTLVLPRDSNSTRFTAGVSEKIPQTNGTLSLTSNLSRSSTRVPSYSSGVTANLSQPLLGGAGKTVATASLERAKLGVGIAYVNYRSRVLTVIRNTENAYYDLVAARETLRIRQLSLELARRLLEENQAKRTSGVATDLDVATAEVGVANARRAELQADQAVRNAEDALLALVNVDNLDVRPGPVAFDDYRDGVPSFSKSYKAARDNYPDTLSATDTIKQLEIDVATAKRNRLPSLTLNASVGYSTDDTSYGDVINSLPNDHGDARSLSLQYSMPWGMRADRARYRSAVASLNSQKVRLEQLEQQLLVNVRSAVRAVETNLASVEIAAQATQLAARQYDLQKARFDAGLSTSRLVLQAQDDLEQARVNELSAKATLRSAVAELHRLEGSSIQRFGVQLPQ
ncbi:TolC family protein [Opitutus sp. ER46]|uniref:TolC family protein n=1 Tax=Opitutus sp. ER46 TaxID=2161864 RepID=UPI000D2FDA50|nr:TolC family protein [Opitutus sp. ER46]PTY00319.1 TolC family protein [Opitutus sp. ER46]